jgi:putative hydrolase of the HAD superfamily
VNLDEAFQTWAGEFVDEHDLGCEAADWLISLDALMAVEAFGVDA